MGDVFAVLSAATLIAAGACAALFRYRLGMVKTLALAVAGGTVYFLVARA